MPRRGHSPEQILNKLKKVQILIEMWGSEYNTIGPHSSPGYRPPAPEIFMPAVQHQTRTNIIPRTASGGRPRWSRASKSSSL
jgi:hypothetical protein